MIRQTLALAPMVAVILALPVFEISSEDAWQLVLVECTSSTMKCNTWASRKAAAILSGYGKTIQTDYHG
jgi:hypothetical protein